MIEASIGASEVIMVDPDTERVNFISDAAEEEKEVGHNEEAL